MRYCKGLGSQSRCGVETGALVVEGMLLLVHSLKVLPKQQFISGCLLKSG